MQVACPSLSGRFGTRNNRNEFRLTAEPTDRSRPLHQRNVWCRVVTLWLRECATDAQGIATLNETLDRLGMICHTAATFTNRIRPQPLAYETMTCVTELDKTDSIV